MTPARDFGVQSYCFRAIKDNARVAQKVREIGLDKIEICAIHADFNNLPAWRKTVQTYRDEGVSVVSLGVQTFTGAPHEREWFECAQAAGARHISAHFRVDSFAAAIPRVQSWCKEFDVHVGIHCHGGYLFGGSPDVLEHLIDLGGPQIGLCLDTAWCLQIGPLRGNPVDWADKFAGRIHGVHYKDFKFEPNGQWKDVVVGEGNLDLPAFVTALESGGFHGMAVIEYEGDPEDPVPALKACVASMRAAV